MKISNKQWIYISTVLFLLILGTLAAVWLHTTKKQVDLTAFTIAVLSAVISLVALFVALQTYISIDSVNTITKMDGNILDNEHYVTCIPELIAMYRQTEEAALREAILGHMTKNLREHSNTAVNFADTLQSMIDVLVLFPAIDLKGQTRDTRYAKDIGWIIKRINDRADELQSISKGNSIQIREAVKLFTSVYEYQRAVESRSLLEQTGLLQIRAAMLRNPVSATVYHNYLGLYYRKGAMRIIDIEDKADVVSLQRWTEIREALHGSELEKLRRYLSHAQDSFAKALQLSHADPMWRGYILFNQARVEFIQRIFFNDENANPLRRMEAAIDARANLNELIDEILVQQQELSILQRHYLYQEEYARQLYVNYSLVLGQAASYRGEQVVADEQYLALIQPHVAKLQEKNQRGLARLHAG